MQVWLWIYCAMRAEKSIDTLFILRTDKRFKDWKEHSRCGRQSLSLASLDSSLYTREPDPSVGCADSSPCRGAFAGRGGSVYGILRCAQDDSKFRGIAGDRKGRPYKDGVTTPQSAAPTAPLTRGAFAGDRKGRPYGPDKGIQTPHPARCATFPSGGRLKLCH